MYRSRRANLNELFRETIHPEENCSLFEIGENKFRLLHVKANDTAGGNKLYLCAHNRLVETKDLDKYIANLDGSMYKRNGFWYIGVLSGKVLDESVDMNRLSFSIPDGGPLDTPIICLVTFHFNQLPLLRILTGENQESSTLASTLARKKDDLLVRSSLIIPSIRG